MILSLFIVFIMVASVFGVTLSYFFDQPANRELSYNEFTFRSANQQFITVINGKEHAFNFFPSDLEGINLTTEVNALLSQPVLTITYDPRMSLAEVFGAVQYNFEAELSDIKTIERALINSTGTSLPEKSCQNSTAAQPVIELLQSTKSGITANNTCIIIDSRDAYDAFQQSERILYLLLGVMK